MVKVQGADQQALILAYEQTIGRDPTAAEWALNQQQMGSGASVAALRAYLAATGYAAAALAKLYADVVGRAVTTPELAADQSYLANGGSLIILRGYLARSNEAAGKLQALYADVSGRAITPGELSSEQAAIGAGAATLAGLRNYFATTNEAVVKLQALYATELGRALTPGEAAADERLIAGGSSLAAIRGYLSTSAEAVRDLTAQYLNMFGLSRAQTAPPPDELLSAERALAGGASQPSAETGTPGFASFVDAAYRLLLGVAPSAADRSAIKQDVMKHLAKLVPGDVGVGDYLVAQAVTAVAAANPEFTNGINAAYEAAVGRPASAVELAATRSEFGAGLGYSSNTVTAATLRTQIAELAGGAPPQQAGYAFDWPSINPQTVADRPGLIYGLPNNVVLTTAREEEVSAGFFGPGHAWIFTLDPATDILQIPKQQAASFSDLTFGDTYDRMYWGDAAQHINLPGGATIELQHISQGLLTAANFRFV